MHEAIQHIEHIALRAWPALETALYDGWVLRFNRGYTGRANSVNPLDGSSLPLAEKIAYCEEQYRQRGLDIRFRLNEASHPQELDAALHASGYEYYSETLVLTMDLEQFEQEHDARFRGEQQLSEEWLLAYATMNQTPEQHIPTARDMLRTYPDSIQPCFAWIEDKAVGLAVHEGDYIGLFDIVVDPNARRQGLGYALVNNMLNWGKQQGAKIAYLQVVPENHPARKLYGELGFTQHHHYWYRIKRTNP